LFEGGFEVVNEPTQKKWFLTPSKAIARQVETLKGEKNRLPGHLFLKEWYRSSANSVVPWISSFM